MHKAAKIYARKTMWKPALGLTMIVLALLLNLRVPLPLGAILILQWLVTVLHMNYDQKFRAYKRDEPEPDLSNGLRNHESTPFYPFRDGPFRDDR
ncbi:MAG: hypothetical protein Q9M48_02875 [Rhodobacterales bacterium]|nr:hypothetical protein [Rhodobacterales bacterium]